MTHPKFSVIIPVYNAAATIERTVCSVLEQSEPDFEIIIVDDGSSDDSLELVLKLASRDERIKVKSQPNRGVAAARNMALSCAQGDLIAFLDADDLWLPTKLARHRAWHRCFPDVDISFARIEFVSDGPNFRRTASRVPRGNLDIAMLIAENPICTSSNIVIRRDCLDRIGHFREDMSYAEDQEWLARGCVRGLIIRGMNCHLVDYRMTSDGLSADLPKMYAGWRLLASTYESHFDRSAAEAQFCRYLARRALRTGGRAQTAMHFSSKGLRLNVRAFFSDGRRGISTLIGAVIAHVLPRQTRIHLFA